MALVGERRWSVGAAAYRDSGEGHAEESGAEVPAAEDAAGPALAEVGTDVPDSAVSIVHVIAPATLNTTLR